MAVVEIEDLTGVMEAVLFPESYERFGAHLVEDVAVEIRAKVDERNDSLQLLIDDLKTYEPVEPEQVVPNTKVLLTIGCKAGEPGTDTMRLNRLAALLREFPGDDDLYVRLRFSGSERYLRSGMRIDWCPDLQRAIEDITGSGAVSPLHVNDAAANAALVAD